MFWPGGGAPPPGGWPSAPGGFPGGIGGGPPGEPGVGPVPGDILGIGGIERGINYLFLRNKFTMVFTGSILIGSRRFFRCFKIAQIDILAPHTNP